MVERKNPCFVVAGEVIGERGLQDGEKTEIGTGLTSAKSRTTSTTLCTIGMKINPQAKGDDREVTCSAFIKRRQNPQSPRLKNDANR